MMRHFHSVKRGVVVDECPRCAGFWLDAGELPGIRSEFSTEEERKKAAQECFSELFDPNLAVARAKTMEDLRKARRIACAFRFICPNYYISGEQGRSDEDLVDAHPLGLGHGVDYGVRDVFRLQPLQVHEAAEALPGVLVCYVIRELGVNGPRPHDRHPDVIFQELLP
jgi:hypothetical protein